MNTIENFILELDGQQKAIVSYLNHVLTKEHELSGKISYNIPIYFKRKTICYLNPIKKMGVELAFIQGYLLSNSQGLLNRKTRKYVAGIDFFDVNEIDEESINQIINEAIILDDLAKQC